MKDGNLKKWAATLKNHTFALYLASKDPRVPFIIKVFIGLLVAYALSPIDLIPDFIPVIGYLDDLLLLSLGLWLVVRLIPRDVWEECQATAKEQEFELNQNRTAAVIIVVIWIFMFGICAYWLWQTFYS
jgi:uncharacterized membrane protein YkvA (DUF1232 family)